MGRRHPIPGSYPSSPAFLILQTEREEQKPVLELDCNRLHNPLVFSSTRADTFTRPLRASVRRLCSRASGEPSASQSGIATAEASRTRVGLLLFRARRGGGAETRERGCQGSGETWLQLAGGLLASGCGCGW